MHYVLKGTTPEHLKVAGLTAACGFCCFAKGTPIGFTCNPPDHIGIACITDDRISEGEERFSFFIEVKD